MMLRLEMMSVMRVSIVFCMGAILEVREVMSRIPRAVLFLRVSVLVRRAVLRVSMSFTMRGIWVATFASVMA